MDRLFPLKGIGAVFLKGYFVIWECRKLKVSYHSELNPTPNDLVKSVGLTVAGPEFKSRLGQPPEFARCLQELQVSSSQKQGHIHFNNSKAGWLVI